MSAKLFNTCMYRAVPCGNVVGKGFQKISLINDENILYELCRTLKLNMWQFDGVMLFIRVLTKILPHD